MTGTAEHEKMRGMSYAPFLAAAFLLWPLTSMAGTQGNVLLLALAAIPALFVARPGIRPAHYLLAWPFWSGPLRVSPGLRSREESSVGH